MKVRDESKVSWVTFSMISSLNGFAKQSQKGRSKYRFKVREVMSSFGDSEHSGAADTGQG